jgi:hypothetical protein
VATPDDFTIVLDEPENMESCGMEVFEGLGQLWNLVERYGMKAPLMINVLDSRTVCIRTFKAARDKFGTWRLIDATEPTSTEFEGNRIAFPLIMNSRDLNGNILKVRVEIATKHRPTEPQQPSSGTVSH